MLEYNRMKKTDGDADMNDIFISYKVQNRATAIEYYRWLNKGGYQAWFDQKIPLGADWSTEIEKNIKMSKVMILLLSEAVLQDESWIKRQIEIGKSYKRPILVIKLDNASEEECIEKYALPKGTSFFEAPSSKASYDFILKQLYPYFFNETAASRQEYEFNEKRGLLRKFMNHPFIVLLIGLVIGVYILIYGFHLFNLHLSKEYSYLVFAMTALVMGSYIPKKVFFIPITLLTIGVLAYASYFMPPFYISGISINGLFTLVIFILLFSIRYTLHRIVILPILYGVISTVIIVGALSVFIVFSKRFLNIDISFALLTVMLLIYQLCCFLKIKSYYKLSSEIRMMKNALK